MTRSARSDVLRIEDLCFRYDRTRGVEQVAMTLRSGEITGFIGANGAGKSTTLRCIVGLLRPHGGSIRLFGEPADARGRRRIGFMPEERGLFLHERARDAIAFHGRMKGLPRRAALTAADRLLERLGLEGRRGARIGDLSKGNAQRVQLLCALVHEPDLLVLDEPLSGLDPIGQGEVLSLFAEFRARGGAILFSTHGLDTAEAACDRVVVVAAGRTVFEGPTAEACEAVTHGAVVVTPDSEALLAAVAAIGASARPLGAGVRQAMRWRVVLSPTTPHPVLLRSLALHEVALYAFEPVAPTLEAAFWDLTAPPPREIAA
ncbi:MAG: ABC transporter ATP-binding protein [Phenylobacterium sp.]|uniref:ABC transporter ATP-binding protein n=1 Tax=Phenylobacterium sp. TaxID=1871053 RepID=UPI00122AFDEC|nr:ABC transporter ATP-binding protein [Phenylobacterium sp.]TAJ72489.1 MAG: ABC transporter ATP-binding protein [Phenylobacterium sp.]